MHIFGVIPGVHIPSRSAFEIPFMTGWPSPMSCLMQRTRTLEQRWETLCRGLHLCSSWMAPAKAKIQLAKAGPKLCYDQADRHSRESFAKAILSNVRRTKAGSVIAKAPRRYMRKHHVSIMKYQIRFEHRSFVSWIAVQTVWTAKAQSTFVQLQSQHLFATNQVWIPEVSVNRIHRVPGTAWRRSVSCSNEKRLKQLCVARVLRKCVASRSPVYAKSMAEIACVFPRATLFPWFPASVSFHCSRSLITKASFC